MRFEKKHVLFICKFDPKYLKKLQSKGMLSVWKLNKCIMLYLANSRSNK